MFHARQRSSRFFDRKTKRRLLLAAILFVSSAVGGVSLVYAVVTGTISIDRIDGNGWRASGLSFEVDLRNEPLQARLRIKQLRFDALGARPDGIIRDVTVDCPRLLLQGDHIACERARVDGAFPSLGVQRLRGSIDFDRRTQALAFELTGLTLAKGTAQLNGEWRADAWTARIKLQQGDVNRLQALLRHWVAQLPSFSASGAVDIDVALRGRGEDIRQIEWQANARQLTAGNEVGSLASDSLTLTTQGSLLNESAEPNGGWRFAVSLNAVSGQAYAEPVFLDFGSGPAQLRVNGEWRGGDTLDLHEFVLHHDNTASVSGTATLSIGDRLQIRRLQLHLQHAQFPNVYKTYLQPFLLNGPLGSLKTGGDASGSLEIADNRPLAMSLDLQDVTADDDAKRWSVDGLSGALRWRQQRDVNSPMRSQLSWRSARLLGMEVGMAALKFAAVDRDFSLSESARIPLFDGAVDIASLQVEHAGQPDMTLQLDATLQPISVERLCAAFGWPSFGGRIGGRLADLQLRNGVLTLGTVLQAEIFDGRVSIADLRLEQPFSKWPRLSADIAIERVDLEQVTRAFSFGLITGRLSGKIAHLQMFNWSPIAFDASLYTSPNDRSRHRISQRAVQSIGKLGGSGSGITAALSSGFLRFFKDFNYERLGIACKLENEVCTMSGVESAGAGYYLVKGRGLPRIDVIGNARRVDWPRMVAQLQAVTQSQGPQVR